MDATDKVILKDGETLKHEKSRSAGFMGQDDIDEYLVLSASGETVAKVVITESMSVKAPFRKSTHLVQTSIKDGVVQDIFL